jgi:D-alanine-D-alanine ligase
MNARGTVGLFFGGRSVEHEVSVVTAQQVMAVLQGTGLHTTPVYIAKTGRWYTGDVLRELDRFSDVEHLLDAATEVGMNPVPQARASLHPVGVRRGLFSGRGGGEAIDVAMPLVHGSHGEDGTLQGFFELCDVPYTGCGVAASALSMDKPLAKAVLRDAGLPVLDHELVARSRWQESREETARSVGARFGYPLFVKPCSVGSSIGVSRAVDDNELGAALDLALTYDSRCLVEPAQDGAVDVNCSVLGYAREARVSVCEQPVSRGLLSYADKYLHKGGGKSGVPQTAGMKGSQRLIPAPLTETLTARIQDAALHAFHAIAGAGVVRVDFLVDAESGRFVANEVNTIPGSLAFYLWEASGLGFAELVTTLIDIARRRHDEKRATVFSIDTWLLRGRPD